MIESSVFQDKNLIGTIKSSENIVANIISGNILSGEVQSDGILIGKIHIVEGYEDYIGDYNITPKIFKQTLSTSDKHMTNDITVKSIPYFEVDNEQSGQTIIIGGI